jgi:hypothetical protein
MNVVPVNSSIATIHETMHYQVFFDGLASYLYVIKNQAEQSVYSINGTQSFLLNQTLTEFGTNSFQFYLLSLLNSSAVSGIYRKSSICEIFETYPLKTLEPSSLIQNAIDTIGYINFSCASALATNSFGTCIVSVSKGTGITIFVDYGDTTTETFPILGSFLIDSHCILD